jgi:hypothetical protein
MTTKIIVENAGPGDVRVNGGVLKAGAKVDTYIYGDTHSIVVTEIDPLYDTNAQLVQRIRDLVGTDATP